MVRALADPSGFLASHRFDAPKAPNSVLLKNIWPAKGDVTPCGSIHQVTMPNLAGLHMCTAPGLSTATACKQWRAEHLKLTLYSPVGPSHWMVFLTQSIMPAAGQSLMNSRPRK